MKRRAIVAVLFVVALVALVVVLVRSGGTDRQEAEAARGKPFVGAPGVTQSVASIKARQRYRDRHPEIERRRTETIAGQQAAAEEAEAAREEGEEPGEEEEATPEEEEDATGEEEAAREEGEAEANIREKPEPIG